MGAVAVIVPWRPERSRQLAWDWVRAWYAREHPGWRVIEAPAPEGPWCKAKAAMPAALEAQARVTVLADADVFTQGLSAAVTAVMRGKPWAIPHHSVHRLTEAASAQVMAGADPQRPPLEEPAYRGIRGGGIVVLSQKALELVPMDPRFLNWGQEDQSWGYALQTLMGKPWRGLEPLWHLWHPPQPRRTRRFGSVDNERLRKRYALANGNPQQMRALLAEVSCLSQASSIDRAKSSAPSLAVKSMSTAEN